MGQMPMKFLLACAKKWCGWRWHFASTIEHMLEGSVWSDDDVIAVARRSLACDPTVPRGDMALEQQVHCEVDNSSMKLFSHL